MDARVMFQEKFIQKKIFQGKIFPKKFFQEKPVRCASDRGR